MIQTETYKKNNLQFAICNLQFLGQIKYAKHLVERKASTALTTVHRGLSAQIKPCGIFVLSYIENSIVMV